MNEHNSIETLRIRILSRFAYDAGPEIWEEFYADVNALAERAERAEAELSDGARAALQEDGK